MQPQDQNSLRDLPFTQQNLWSSLASEFKVFESRILNSLFDESQTENQGPEDNQISLSLIQKERVKKEISNFEGDMKKKLCKILFQSSINASQSKQKVSKISQLQKRVLEDRLNNERKIKELNQKMESLEKLVKVYEKTLSQTKNPPLSSSNQPISSGILPMIEPAKQIPQQSIKRENVLKCDRIYSIKIQNEDMRKQVSSSNLSYSRLTSSRMSGSRLERGPLKELENNWNKSVNVSSKSFRSGTKEHQRSAQKEQRPTQKEQKSFVKSHIKQRDLNLSSIKENTTPSNLKAQSRMKESTISEFCLSKN